MKIRENVSFKELTTFKVGGFAKTVVYIEAKDELREIFKEIIGNKEKYLILGGGSNVVAGDDDFEGAVIIPSIKLCTPSPMRFRCPVAFAVR